MILQHKEKDNWVDKKILDIGRNYGFFGVLAGVRSWNIKPIAYPKGLPSDFKMNANFIHPLDPKKFDQKDFDDNPGYYMGEHSYSWLTLDEINKYNWKNVEEDVCVDQEFKDLFFHCKNLKNWRVVFGFDS